MALKQMNRLLKLKTPLGEDSLLLTGFRGHEEISRLFHFELDLISDDNGIAAAQIVGKNVTFSIDLADGSSRSFNGFVSRLFAGDEDLGGRRNYRAEVVPWLWFLTRTSDCRIFQNKTVPEIVEQIFKDLGFSDFETAGIRGSHPKRDYCVQYCETDFNFVSRLMEEEGIFYFFKHEDGKHSLVLADEKRAYKDCGEKEVDYPHHYGARAITDHITRWEHRYEFRTGKWSQTDYNFETPSADLMTNENSLVELPGVDKYEFYDYPGRYGKTADGRPLTRVRMEEEEVEHDVVEGESLCKTFTPGGKFKVRQHRSSSEEGKSYVITSIEHAAQEPLAYETGGAAAEFDYRNSFKCIPADVPFRPQRTTPKPREHGIQTAVVVGPSGEKIFPDKYGRVKVQFHWDRYGKKDENSSCWIRISFPWAGQGWGGVSLPHVGQEVIIAFEHGDVDRPIIVGRLYNAEQMPPLNLPAEKDWTINRDHYGNEVNMKGDEGTISLICPSHTSEIHLGRSINLVTLSDYIRENHGDTAIETFGNWTQDVFGDTKVNIGANVTEAFVGWNHKWIGGFVTKFIGGYKGEMIVGKESKVIGGVKSEVIKGSVVKIHKGQEYKHAQNGRKENQPSLKQMVKDVAQYRTAEKTVLKADRQIKAAGKLKQKGSEIIEEADKMKVEATDAFQKFGAKLVGKYGEHKVKVAGNKKEKAGLMKWLADAEIKAKASVVKLG
jgi:type VI secretion system secreted protein VgrG